MKTKLSKIVLTLIAIFGCAVLTKASPVPQFIGTVNDSYHNLSNWDPTMFVPGYGANDNLITTSCTYTDNNPSFIKPNSGGRLSIKDPNYAIMMLAPSLQVGTLSSPVNLGYDPTLNDYWDYNFEVVEGHVVVHANSTISVLSPNFSPSFGGGNFTIQNGMSSVANNGIIQSLYFTNSGGELLQTTTGTLIVDPGLTNANYISNTGTIKAAGTFQTVGFAGTGGIIDLGNSNSVSMNYNGTNALTNALSFSGQDLKFGALNNITYSKIIGDANTNYDLTGATVSLTLDPGYTPTANDEFDLIQGQNITGTPTYNLPTLPTNFSWTTTITNGILKATIVYNAVLPVQLATFELNQQGETVQLNWNTASEINALNFEIERSTDGVLFEKIGTVLSIGAVARLQNYSFIDRSPINGVNYYRLRMNDIDGHYDYSKTLQAKLEVNSKIELINTLIQNQLLASTNMSTTYTIRNTSGQVMITAQLQEGTNNIACDAFAPGIYLFHANNKTIKFCKK
jgi:hypothetical protein